MQRHRATPVSAWWPTPRSPSTWSASSGCRPNATAVVLNVTAVDATRLGLPHRLPGGQHRAHGVDPERQAGPAGGQPGRGRHGHQQPGVGRDQHVDGRGDRPPGLRHPDAARRGRPLQPAGHPGPHLRHPGRQPLGALGRGRPVQRRRQRRRPPGRRRRAHHHGRRQRRRALHRGLGGGAERDGGRPAANGYLTAYPQGTTAPTASNLNYRTGETVPNRVIVPVSANGQVSLTANQSTDVLVDVSGWFSTASGSGIAVHRPGGPGAHLRHPGRQPVEPLRRGGPVQRHRQHR